ncbi:O-antigen ligase family protein [Aerosakkonema funiforme]|uniref:O-antigen ligase family protein n=1 Tax=Aerosakkonema funiforme TaxID=1246630 RepID=UPI0035B75103
MKSFYTLLFALCIILIDPFGNSRGSIWTEPKVLAVLLITLLNFSILWEERKSLTIPRNWKTYSILWALFLGIGLLSTLLSPFPLRSLFGQEQMGDGWLYWLTIAAFTLSNTLLLTHHPELFRPQLKGLLIGGVILAISIFPQVIDWRIDYTATMGQLIQKNVLASTIFQGQQPIGLYSHRGHASFVLAAIVIFLLVSWQRQWISSRTVKMVGVLMILAFLLTQTRQAVLALRIATVYLLGKKYYKLLVPATIVCLLVIGIATTTRQIDNLPLIKQITSDRIYLWQLSKRGISQRPLLGWGMNGFGTAYPYILNPDKTVKVVRLGDFSLDYVNKKGKLSTIPLPTAKAHNLLLDTTLSVGILGLLSYSALIIFAIKQTIQSPYQGIEAIAICYLIFTFTWFECAQYTHIMWWALSFWGTSNLTNRSNSVNPSLEQTAPIHPPRDLIAATQNKPLLVILIVSFLLLSTTATYYFINQHLPFLKAASNQSTCASSTSSPTDNAIAKRYGDSAYPWTNNIKWNCVYNIKDFPGETILDRYNKARDAAVANGGGVVYFPAGIYQFTDNLYLKDGVVIRGETPSLSDAKSTNYNPTTKFIFPKYEPKLSGSGTPNSTAFKKILTTSPNTDSNIGIINVDINRAGIYLLGDVDVVRSKNIIIYGIRSNNVADPIPNVPDRSYQSPWLRYSHPFAANIKITADANVLVSNNRLNDAITDNYDQPGYQIKAFDNKSTITYTEGWKVPFHYGNHYGIVVDRTKAEGIELDFEPAADPNAEPGLFRKGIVIRDNWIYHTMRAAIRAAGDGLVIKDNQIKDQPNKQWWTNPWGNGLPIINVTYENRAIDWAGWNVLIQGNRYEVYRHQLLDTKNYSVDGEGILIQECCGGTQINGVFITENEGNSYIGLYKTPYVKNVEITRNKLLSNVTDTPLIYVSADTNNGIHAMENVRIEDNVINGGVMSRASKGGSGNTIKNNTGSPGGFLKYSCHVAVEGNNGFKLKPCLKTLPSG